MDWKPDWPQAKANLTKWWNGEGLAVCVTAPRDVPIEPISEPRFESDPEKRRTDPVRRCDEAEHQMAHRAFLAEAFPYLDTQIGPGSLGTFLGAEPHFADTTVWYEPCIDDPDCFGPIRFDAKNRWFKIHMAVIEEGLRRANGRYLVGIPDLIENLDTLAAMRGTEPLLRDLIDRPGWVHDRLAEINEAYSEAFDLMYEQVRDEDGGNAFASFRIWGPGKTAKLQCDFSCMISPRMFREFVRPYLSAQCDWLDYSLYHLDGVGAVQHVEALLEIESLKAIQWTAGAGKPGGGDPQWYDLYRRVKAGGKSIQAVGVSVDQVIPLIEAVGPQGTFIQVSGTDQASAEKLLQAVEQYRR